jgi:formate dehydrogenase maturation protein FdhE
MGDGVPLIDGANGRIGVRKRLADSVAPIPPLKETKMTERLETLNKARARMLEDRDMHAKVLAAPFDRDKAERARNKFIEIQLLIDALDRAIGGERIISPTG